MDITVDQHAVGLRRERAVRSLTHHVGLQLAGDLGVDGVLQGGRHQQVDVHREQVVVGDLTVGVGVADDAAGLALVLFHRAGVETVLANDGTTRVGDSDDASAVVLDELPGVEPGVAVPLDRNRGIVEVAVKVVKGLAGDERY